MNKIIKLVVYVTDIDEKWVDSNDMKTIHPGPKNGELCTVEGEIGSYYYLQEYQHSDIVGERDKYGKQWFIEIINSKEEVATVQIAGIQVPQLIEQ